MSATPGGIRGQDKHIWGRWGNSAPNAPRSLKIEQGMTNVPEKHDAKFRANAKVGTWVSTDTVRGPIAKNQ